MTDRCILCGGVRKKVDDIICDFPEGAVVARGTRCQSCGEETFDEEDYGALIKVAKKIGAWGSKLKLHRKLGKSGRGTVLRIPTDIERTLHLKGNEEVAISTIGKNRIIIEIL